MYGKAYKGSRLGNRWSGGTGEMKPTNKSEVGFGLVLLAGILIVLGSCAAPVLEMFS